MVEVGVHYKNFAGRKSLWKVSLWNKMPKDGEGEDHMVLEY